MRSSLGVIWRFAGSVSLPKKHGVGVWRALGGGPTNSAPPAQARREQPASVTVTKRGAPRAVPRRRGWHGDAGPSGGRGVRGALGVFPGSDGCEEGAGPFACSGTSQFSSLTGFRSPGGAQRAACWSSAEQRRRVQTSRRGSMNLLVSHSSHTERDKGGIRAVRVVVLHQPDLDFATWSTTGSMWK